MKNRFFFLHIPRTAGSYMWGKIQSNFPVDRAGFWAPRDFQGLLSHPNPNNLDAISGHLHYNIDDMFTDGRPMLKWTMLRHPVERTMSQFIYNRDVLGLCVSIEEYMTSEVVGALTDNVMVRMIGSSITMKKAEHAVMSRPKTIDPSIGSFLQLSREFDDLDKCLDRARHRLRYEMYYGIKEYLDISARFLSNLTGFRIMVIEDAMNHRRYRSLAGHDHIEFISHLNRWDMALYEEMRVEFESRHSQLISRFDPRIH